MGVLNVTPDSFSDGGQFLDFDKAVAHGLAMAEEGADVIDVGGESTRPGADPVIVQDEVDRTRPVVAALVRQGLKVSIDTMKPPVARAALDEGAWMVNDVSGARTPGMLGLVAEKEAAICLMHMKGTPRTMQQQPEYEDVVQEVGEYLKERAEAAEAAGVKEVWIDPGIGFGKTTQHNLDLIDATDRLAAFGWPVLVGASRKSFIGRITGGEDNPAPAEHRLEGTLVAHLRAAELGARMLRVHDVAAHRRALAMNSAWA